MNIENYFVSDEFLEVLKPISKRLEQSDGNYVLGEIISYAIKYVLIMGNDETLSNENLTNFLKKVVDIISKIDDKTQSFSSSLQHHISILYVDELLSSLQLDRKTVKEEDLYQELFCIIIKRLESQMYMYHAFNSVYLDGIKTNGLDPGAHAWTSQEEINEIDDIFKKYKINRIFGWQRLNCEGKVSFSLDPLVSYDYGIRSPEWFSQFVGGSTAYIQGGVDRNAFQKGDYNLAKNNLLTLMKAEGFSPDDQAKVLAFFEKKWPIYANNNPMLVIKPFAKIDMEELILVHSDYFEEKDIDLFMWHMLNFMANGLDQQSKKKISMEDAKFIKLPKFYEFIKKLSMPMDDTVVQDDVIDKTTNKHK